MSLRVKNLLRDEENWAVSGATPSLKEVIAAARAAGDGPVSGMFVCSSDPTSSEICAGAGFDYLLIDGEHSAMSLADVQSHLRTIAGYPTLAVVRVPANDPVIIKQYLDLGVQSLIVPMVDTAENAAAAVAAIEYAPAGVRGVGSALARSARWNRIPGYLGKARETLTLLVQVESATAVANAAEIAAVDGIDGIFIGPSDMSATMGLLGQQSHPHVVAAVKETIAAVKAAGKFVGVNAFVKEQAEEYLAAGADFVNVGADVALLARASEALAGACASGDGGGTKASY